MRTSTGCSAYLCHTVSVLLLSFYGTKLNGWEKPDFQRVVREAWIGFGLSHVCFELTSIISANSLTAWRVGGCSLYCILALSVGLQLALCDIWMWTWGSWSGSVDEVDDTTVVLHSQRCTVSYHRRTVICVCDVWTSEWVTETKLEIFNWPDKQENSLYAKSHRVILIGKSIHSFSQLFIQIGHEPCPTSLPQPLQGVRHFHTASWL